MCPVEKVASDLHTLTHPTEDTLPPARYLARTGEVIWTHTSPLGVIKHRSRANSF